MSRYFSVTIPMRQCIFSPSALPSGIQYIKGQLEVGDNTGLLHWQLMVVTERKQRFSFLQRLWPFAHVEKSRSSALESYVWKEDTRVPDSQFELGRPPLSGTRGGHDWEAIWEQAKTGDILSVPAAVRVSSYRVLKDIRKDHLKPVGIEKTVHVFCGATGTGKSRRAWHEATFDAYPKDPNTKFWDGYDQHENVVIDEFRGKIDISHMLRWLDRYPVIVEAKHGAVCLRARNIWITSNLHPREWYPDLDPGTVDALIRRLNIVVF